MIKFISITPLRFIIQKSVSDFCICSHIIQGFVLMSNGFLLFSTLKLDALFVLFYNDFTVVYKTLLLEMTFREEF